jgi:hypothetical protein
MQQSSIGLSGANTKEINMKKIFILLITLCMVAPCFSQYSSHSAVRQVKYTGLLDENGDPYGVKQIDGKPRTSSMPYSYDIAEGNVSGHEAIRIFGHNDNIGTAWEVLSHNGGVQHYVSSAEVLQFSSSDIEDDVGGDGAITVYIEGLDASYVIQSETVTMDGITNSPTSKAYLRVHFIRVLTAGATGWNEGIISVKDNGASNTIMTIPIQDNESHCAIYTVPSGKTLFVTHWVGGESSNKGTDLSLWIRPFGGLWYNKREVPVLSSVLDLDINFPLSISEKTDIEYRVMGVLAGANVGGGLECWIE